MAAELEPQRIFAKFTPKPVHARVYANFPRSLTQPAPIYATFEPAALERAQKALRDSGVVGPTPVAPPAAPLTLDQQLLKDLVSLLSPDDWQLQYKFLTSQVQVSFAYDYTIPKWCRHILLTNRSANLAAVTNGGNLYYWYDLPSAGAKQLPQNYATLIANQSISENSDFAYLTVFADTTCTDPGWEIRFSGRKEDAMVQGKPGHKAKLPQTTKG